MVQGELSVHGMRKPEAGQKSWRQCRTQPEPKAPGLILHPPFSRVSALASSEPPVIMMPSLPEPAGGVSFPS